jgi:hypothetical protein
MDAASMDLSDIDDKAYDDIVYQDQQMDIEIDKAIQEMIDSGGKSSTGLREKLRHQLTYSKDPPTRMHLSEPLTPNTQPGERRTRSATQGSRVSNDAADTSVLSNQPTNNTSSRKQAKRGATRKRRTQPQSNAPLPAASLQRSRTEQNIERPGDDTESTSTYPLNDAQLLQLTQDVYKIIRTSQQPSTPTNPMTDSRIPQVTDNTRVGQSSSSRPQSNTRQAALAAMNTPSTDHTDSIRAMEESVQLALSVPDSLLFPYNNKTCHGNWKNYVSTLIEQLDKPSKSLKINVGVMGTALNYLAKHAYYHADILSACEVLASRVAAIINAASAGNTSEAYNQFEVLMPTAVQTNSAMTMIPPEKFKTVQQHTKMLSRIQPTDTKTGKRRYEGYGNYGTDYRSQQPYAKRQRQSGGYNGNRYRSNNNNNSSGSRPTHTNNNSGSSSAAAQQ